MWSLVEFIDDKHEEEVSGAFGCETLRSPGDSWKCPISCVGTGLCMAHRLRSREQVVKFLGISSGTVTSKLMDEDDSPFMEGPVLPCLRHVPGSHSRHLGAHSLRCLYHLPWSLHPSISKLVCVMRTSRVMGEVEIGRVLQNVTIEIRSKDSYLFYFWLALRWCLLGLLEIILRSGYSETDLLQSPLPSARTTCSHSYQGGILSSGGNHDDTGQVGAHTFSSFQGTDRSVKDLGQAMRKVE
jgi:hypothetical protein